MTANAGKFITVEGIEGVGKSTNINAIRRVLDGRNINCIVTREPGGTDLGEDIRSLLLGHKHQAMSSDCELLLMFASRAQHLAQVITPALKRGQWVICDRFTDATYAYQGGGRGIDDKHIALLEDWVHGNKQPDLTFLLDTDVATGMARVHKRGATDRFESETIAFFERVRSKYLARAKQHPSRIAIIDAGRPLSEVEVSIRERLNLFLEHCQQ
ncbi:MAG: dTMP kinase [Gammaproteobacteria bacterium]|nr:MAG: dTMP kinase [Gammaproteobacteria bacterium]